jgi:hypothetical protein
MRLLSEALLMRVTSMGFLRSCLSMRSLMPGGAITCEVTGRERARRTRIGGRSSCGSRAGYEREESLRAGLLALIHRAPRDADIGLVGAEPLENFTVDDEDRLRWIEDQARRSERFRAALASMWIDHLPHESFLRIERVADVQLPWHGVGPRPTP